MYTASYIRPCSRWVQAECAYTIRNNIHAKIAQGTCAFLLLSYLIHIALCGLTCSRSSTLQSSRIRTHSTGERGCGYGHQWPSIEKV